MNTKWILVLVLFSLTWVLTGCSSSHDNMSGMSHEQHMSHKQQMDHSQNQMQEKPASVKVNWTFSPSQVQPHQKETITIQVQDQSGKPVEQFDINHEKKMHLIVVSKDLSFYNHIHPDYQGKGVFQVDTQFPQGGEYKLISDFKPMGQEATAQHHWVQVSGKVPSARSIQPDSNLTKIVDGKEVTLSFDKKITANQATMLTFNIKDAKTKKSITNLQPYLGAIGHVVILTEDTEKYLHVHPMNEKATGPDAQFHTTFQSPGIYKIWGEFKHNGKVFTVPFVVKVT